MQTSIPIRATVDLSLQVDCEAYVKKIEEMIDKEISDKKEEILSQIRSAVNYSVTTGLDRKVSSLVESMVADEVANAIDPIAVRNVARDELKKVLSHSISSAMLGVSGVIKDTVLEVKKEIEAEIRGKVSMLMKAEYLNADTAPNTQPPLTNATLSRPVKDLGLTVRTTNCLAAAEIHCIHDLIRHSQNQLLKIPNMGRKSVNEIKGILATYGLHLGSP